MDVSRKRVLIVDDEPHIRESLRLVLEEEYEVVVAAGADEALGQLHSHDSSQHLLPNLILLDVAMPGIDGVELLKQLTSEYPRVPVVMLTANNNARTAVKALKLGAVDYLNKPFDVEELLGLIGETIETAEAENGSEPVAVSRRIAVGETNGDFGTLVGTHPLMLELYKKIEQVAVRDTTVLVTGESGTGKELVAKELHRRSSRATGPFIALNCAAIPESLIESELFGHEKGSFTHAVDRRIGHFELANNGTLFLDEIGELTLPVQVKMLRFLQEQEFYRVGRSKPIKVDVRIIAATNKSLEHCVNNGTFRQDLFYRVNVVAIESPPLRERIEDLPNLVTAFAKRLATSYGKVEPQFSADCLTALSQYSWPGNVRELENVIESILALCANDQICANDLPSRLRQSRASNSSDLKQSVLEGVLPFDEAERQFEREIILKALQKTDFIQTKAAELLGISRRILKYKMDKLGINDRPPETMN